MATLNRRAFLGATPFAVGAALSSFFAINSSRGPGRLNSAPGSVKGDI